VFRRLWTSAAQEEQTNVTNPDSLERLVERRQEVLRSLRTYYDFPFHPVRGEGQWVYDASGRRILDAYNNVAHVGHCHPHVVEALCQQAKKLNTNTRYLYEPILDYAERLVGTVSPDHACMFTCTGSEANDLAWRLATSFTHNRGVITTEHCYHGNTTFLATIDGSSMKVERDAVDWWAKVPAPRTAIFETVENERRASLEYARHYDAAIEKLDVSGHRPAAFFFDSYFCTDGVFLPPAGFMNEGISRVRKAGGLIIADEVQAGLARSGSHMWAFQRLGVDADIVVMGKPMGNGHPIGVVVARKEIIDEFYAVDRYFNTFAGNPVSCAVGMAVMEVVERQHLQENARKMGDLIEEGVEKLSGRHPIIGGIRGQGLLLGIELVLDQATRAPAGKQARWVVNEMCRRGVLIGLTGTNRKERNVLKIRPPMVFDEVGVDIFISTLKDVLAALETDFREPN
jgi:4-aminobutyrate aminotransferase-like enzyme